MKAILYGHAWMSGALTAFAFFGFLRSFNDPRQVWVWASVLGVGLLWALLGFASAAHGDGEGGGGEDLEGPVPAPGPGCPPEEGAGPARRRGTPMRYGGPLLMLLAFLVVTVLLAGAVGGWWTITPRPPRPLIPSTPFVRPLQPKPGRG